ncbi:phospholipase D-like domain-containing protein [Nonomuraea sp. NBC_01738]|uniref:phospholipase D-like domain-containing protein n=1 Tax=Nonomuraea sp. NBC_01738 TaxID=2976003 RepID=UPI002E0EADF6|nr:phospholipase D-like domain-containing protein [Nonomuraea sp. NBC_01738]
MLKILPLLTMLLGLTTTPAQTAATPQLEAHFSIASVTGATDNSLETQLLTLIDQAAPTSTLRLATFVLSRQVIKDRLVQAAGRGVDVRVVAEKTNHNPLLDQLATDLGPGHVVLCADACNSTNTDVMHHKFAVVSKLLDERTDVVLQSSQNLDASFGAHQNMLISYGDPGLAAGYTAVFDKLWNQQIYTWSTPFTSTSGKITAWMMPRAATDDPAAQAINAVTCPGTIRIVQSQFSDERDAINTALTNKKQAGCTIQIYVAESNPTTDQARNLAAAGIIMNTFRPGGCHEPRSATCDTGIIHSKIILTEDATHQYVYTGSHNLNGGSLTTANDSFLRIDDPATYAAYDANLDLIAAQTTQIVPATYPNAALQMTANGPQDQRNPRASAERNGYTAVTWESAGQIHARIYRNGQPVTAPTRIDMGGVACTTGWNHIQPAAGIDDTGTAYLTWAEDGDCRGEHNIALRTLTPTGQLSATTWINNPQWAGDQTRPRIAVTPAGAFTVVWEDAATTTIRAAGYTTPAHRTWGPTQLSAGDRPDLAVDTAGNATIAWQQTPNLYGTRISPTGATTTPRTRLDANTATQHLAPAVATTPAGDTIVAWSDNVGDIWRIRARGFTSTLTQRFTERAVLNGKDPKGPQADGVSEYPPLCSLTVCAVQGSPSIATAPDGRFLVGWTESDIWNSGRTYEVYAKGFNADGTTTGRFPAERLNPNTAGTQFATALSAGPSGFTYFYTEDFRANGYADIIARTGFTNTTY